MAKIDIESAYRLIPVHPTDRPLQAMEWKGKSTWTQCCSPGICSGPWDTFYRILPGRKKGTSTKACVYCKVPQDPGGA